MNVRSLKLVGAAAGLLFLVGTAPNVYAQAEVLNDIGKGTDTSTFHASTFTFQQSLILNQIGFMTAYQPNEVYRYKIGDNAWTTVTADQQDGRLLYYTFANPTTYTAGTTVVLESSYYNAELSSTQYLYASYSGMNDVGVSFSSELAGYTAGNIRVSPSNPGSNVAPEPGSIALLLTGGGALAGIALRRRRNAA